ncbi:unnamed protein product [Caenorhabditis sp. 36 PRJEB53466]|nr:unnamed protein product [Caenorhabditis sp. 36 PRJEB53466]
MAYDERLGYDPDEWEECPESEHFLVFSAFTRYLLTAAAIAFVYYFFKLLDEHKNPRQEVEKTEEEQPQTTVEQVLAGASHKLQDVKEHVQQIPQNAEDLLREADQYLKQTVQPVQNNTHQLVENKFPSLEVDHNVGHPITATKEKFDTVLSAVDNHLYETKNMDLSPKSRDSTQFEQIPSVAQEEFAHDFEHVPPHLKKAAEQYYAQQQPQDPRPPVPQHQAHFQQSQPVPISPTEQKLLQEFDIYDAPADQRINQVTEQLGQRPLPSQPFQQVQQYPQGAFQQFQPQPLHIQAEQYPPNLDLSQLSPGTRALYEQQQFVDISQLSPGARRLITEQQGAFQPVARKLTREKRLSEQDERALQDWEKEKALLEADRIKKLLDHEVGGDSNTDLSSSQKAYDHFSPASHISYESQSAGAQIQPLTPTAPKRADQIVFLYTKTNHQSIT